jgi:hypothetical protein
MDVPLDPPKVKLMATLGKSLDFSTSGPGIRVPLANRMYLECSGVSRESVIAAFQNAKIHT